MSKTISNNNHDTAISGYTAKNLVLAAVNFPVDFRVMVDEPNEVRLTNIRQSITTPEEIRIACQPIKDIYKNSSLSSSVMVPLKSGVQTLVQLNATYTVTESITGNTYSVPISGHIVLKLPNEELVTPDLAKAFLTRLSACLFGTDSDTSDRINDIRHGVLKPAGL